jgi:hypothetical protein
LYRPAKYSHSLFSSFVTSSPPWMEVNFSVKMRMVSMWNLFWWDYN